RINGDLLVIRQIPRNPDLPPLAIQARVSDRAIKRHRDRSRRVTRITNHTRTLTTTPRRSKRRHQRRNQTTRRLRNQRQNRLASVILTSTKRPRVRQLKSTKPNQPPNVNALPWRIPIQRPPPGTPIHLPFPPRHSIPEHRHLTHTLGRLPPLTELTDGVKRRSFITVFSADSESPLRRRIKIPPKQHTMRTRTIHILRPHLTNPRVPIKDRYRMITPKPVTIDIKLTNTHRKASSYRL